MAEISFDPTLIAEIASRFDLREPNRLALEAVVQAVVGQVLLIGGHPGMSDK